MTTDTRVALEPAVRAALVDLLWTLADDEFVIGFSDSEWTGIAPLLEEDVAMSSLAQDELGHARAFYGLLGDLLDQDPDGLAYDREAHEVRHCRLLDHERGDWAFALTRRYLYETADAIRLEALVGGAYMPLADLVAKVRREERYHLMHVDAWLRRLAGADGEPRNRLLGALETLAPDGPTVFTPLADEKVLIDKAILDRSMRTLRDRWLASIEPTFRDLDLPIVAAGAVDASGRSGHSDAFARMWGDITSVRRLDPEATW